MSLLKRLLRTGAVVQLSIWGALYFAWAVLIAHIATAAVKSHLDEVLPLMSEFQTVYVSNALQSRFPRRRINLISLGAASLATCASLFALKSANITTYQLALIASEFFVLYVTAAQATYAARFYGVFAEAIEKEPQALGMLVPAESPIVLAMRSAGATVLIFWLGIMLAVLTLMVHRDTLRNFVLVVVPIASFFSFMFGSAVFIAAESRLRRACRRAVVDVRLKLNVEARILIDRLGEPNGTALERLEKLTRIATAVTPSDTKGIFLVIVSIVTPFAGPAVALFNYFGAK